MDEDLGNPPEEGGGEGRPSAPAPGPRDGDAGGTARLVPADAPDGASGGKPPESLEEKIARIKHELDSVPASPGVYLWKDANGEVIYVGKAK